MTFRTPLSMLLLLPFATIRGQSPSLRADLMEWRDSVSQSSDTVGLEQLQRRVKRVADSLRGDPAAEMRLGWTLLRLAQLTDNTRLYEQAARTFNGVTEDHPDWAVAWTGLAEADLTEAQRGSSVSMSLQRMFGFDPEARLVSKFLRGTGTDSNLTEGVARLGRRALDRRVPLETTVALRVFRGLPLRVATGDPALVLIRTYLEDRYGEADSALAVIERAARLHDRDPLILRAQAQMRFRTGRTDGPGPWYLGLRQADSAALWRYLRDMQLVVPDSILARIAAAAPDARGDTVRAFWASRDPDGLPTQDDRLTEHYRRLGYARNHYVRRSVMEATPEYDADTMAISSFDARGEILLRHGSPTKRTSIGNFGGPDVEVTLRIVGMPPNESWSYARGDSTNQFYHFVRPTKDADFVSVESILDILAYSEQFKRFRPGLAAMVAGDTTRRTVLVHGGELVSIVAQELLASRQPMSPIYAEMINQGIRGADSMQATEREIGRESLARESSYELGFELPLDAAIEILAVGSDQHGPVMQIAFAISAADLTPREMPRGVMYPVRMRVAVRDAAGRNVVVVDTLRAFLSASKLTPSQHLVGQLPIRVPPGEYRVRASLESDRRGLLSPPTQVRVPGTSTTLTLSDISIGTRAVPILWRSPSADTAWANPLGRYRNNDDLQLYFEVGGLPAGTAYRTEIAIDAGSDAASCSARGNVLTLSFDATHPGRVAREQRALSLNRLRPGNYVMAVTVSTEAGARATRCRAFVVTRE